MPSDFALKTMNTIHRTLLKVTGGKVGWKVGGMQALELTTTGRKSGAPRSVMLTSPVQVGNSLVIVASKGGHEHDPAWFRNLQKNPDVKVATKGGAAVAMRARVATAEERADLWPTVTAKYKNYAAYQTKTTREIPLVFLDPVK